VYHSERSEESHTFIEFLTRRISNFYIILKNFKIGDPSDLRPQDDKEQSNFVILSVSEESHTFFEFLIEIHFVSQKI